MKKLVKIISREKTDFKIKLSFKVKENDRFEGARFEVILSVQKSFKTVLTKFKSPKIDFVLKKFSCENAYDEHSLFKRVWELYMVHFC